MYQRKVDLDMLNAVKIKLADVSSISPSAEQRWDCALGTLFGIRFMIVYTLVNPLPSACRKPVAYLKRNLHVRFFYIKVKASQMMQTKTPV